VKITLLWKQVFELNIINKTFSVSTIEES
jgi:hypothetical protein